MEENIIVRMLKIKDIKEKEIVMNDLKEEKTRLGHLKDEDSYVRQAIIDFIATYNPLNPEWKNKEVAEFCQKLIPFFDNGKDIAIPILKSMEDIFKNLSPIKILINFEKKFNKKIAYLECCFKLLLLTKNLENLLYGMKNFLFINTEFLSTQFKTLDFESPFTHILLKGLVENFICGKNNLKNEKIKEIYKEQVNKLTNYYKFFCPQCLQFQLFRYYDNGKFIVQCSSGHNYSDKIKNIGDLQLLSEYIIKCQICNRKLEMYERNFICFQCVNFFCEKCSQLHKNECPQFSLCELYKCGFYCRDHNKKYISICSICEKNLCEICKNIHYHRIPHKEYYSIQKIVDANKNMSSKENKEDPKSYILKGLISSYEFFQNYYMIPLFFRQSIFYSLYSEDIKIKISDFFFESFYDNDFIDYYSTLINQMKNGNMNAINILKEIREKYKENKLSINESFEKNISTYLNIAIANNSRMIWHLFSFNCRLKSLLEILKDNELKYGYISKLKSDNNKLDTKIDLFKIKILSLIKSNDKYKQGLKLLFDRQFSDLIIKILFKKYHSYFQKIKLDFIIAQELMEYFNNDDDKKAQILQEIGNENFINNNKQLEGEKNEAKTNEENNNKIKFIKSIYIDEININKTLLNFLLELFFYNKKKGNQNNHPNIEPEESIQLKEEKYKDSIDIIFNSNNDNSLQDKEESGDIIEAAIYNKVLTEMKKIENEIKQLFFEMSTKKEFNIIEIINSMFYGKINLAWENQFAILSTMMKEINNIIKEKCEIDLVSFKYDFQKLKDYEKIIESLGKENILKNIYLDINTKEYNNLKYLISKKFEKLNEKNDYGVIKSLKIIDYPMLIREIYDKTIESNFPKIYTEHEYFEIINLIAIPFIIDNETNNLKILKSNLINEFQESMAMVNIKSKAQKIFERINDYFKKDEITEDYIESAKKFCLAQTDKNDEEYNKIINLKISINSVIFYLEKLLGEENIYCIDNDKKKFSLPTLLYYFQNYN